ncbi:yor378w-like protein [Colletotrichum kahawae]|uniref:Yor378w-like protein n=1 Tax=Colletotrichum kahawae TaxID=34407 RepID=A0AAD9YND5_COLKA|nr:yor378w-like protein [Colletotrichum kahawae]
MQRVADVMIAVTESFRQQFRNQQHPSNDASRHEEAGDLDWRASVPELAFPVADDDLSDTRSHTSSPSAAPPSCSPPREGPISPTSPTSPTSPITPGSLSSTHNPPIVSLASSATPEALSSRPLLASQSPRGNTREPLRAPPSTRNITVHDLGLYGGLAPETLAHPSEYPAVFEAARKIVITQRSRRATDTTPEADRRNDRPLTAMQTNAVEDHLPWASRGYLYQAQNHLDKRPVSAPGFAQEVSLLGITGLHQILMFAGLAQGIAPALEIANSLTNLSEGQHSWFTAGFVLTLGVFALPSMRIGDVFGHKRVLIYGCLWYAFWSLLAGFSKTVHNGGYDGVMFFCVCRAMQGIGPALSVPNGLSILEASFPPGQRKDTALSLYSSGAPLDFVVGSVMSSAFAVNFSWEWGFFVLAAVCSSAAGLSVLILPHQDPREGCCFNDIWVKLDFMGIILSTFGLVLFSFAWNQAPAVGWRTPYTYFLLIIGVLFLAAFIYNETVVPNPLVPLRVMNLSANIVLSCIAAGWGCFIVWAFYLFQVMEAARDWNCLVASAAIIPIAVESLAVTFLLAYLTPGVEVYWAFLVSLIGFPLASVLVATVPLDQTYWANMFVSTLLVPLGMVMAGPLATILLSNGLPEESIPNSSPTLSSFDATQPF